MAVALCLGSLAATAFGQIAPQSTDEPVRVIRLKQPAEVEYYAQAIDEAPPRGEYWIGIALGDLPPLAKKQLKLEHGLVVEDVLPDSPAKKAGFQQHDVLLQAGDKPLNEPADILQAVEAAKETELTLEAVRDGQHLMLKVTPVKRPQPEVVGSRPVDEARAELREESIKKIEEALAELKGENGVEALALYFARPGVVATNVRDVKLPENMSISVTKEGDSPAKLHVKQDGKEWNVTVDKINELPDDVRRHVEALLGKVIHPMMSERARAIVGGTRRLSTRLPGVPGVAPPVSVPQQPQAPQPPRATQPYQYPSLKAYRVVPRDGSTQDKAVEEKLNQIIKKLDTRDTSLEQLQEEVQRLRKELDELRNE
jgi:membrane-associated protease RseP (regulator of RpoE activity)